MGTPAVSQNSVAVAPGATAWMRMFLSANSCLSDWLKASTNALLPPYTPFSTSGLTATMDAMLMTAPPPRATMPGTAAYVSCVSAVTFRLIMSVILSTSAVNSGALAPSPALFTSSVMLASVRSTCSIRARSALSFRSAATTSTVRPVSSARRRASASRRCRLRATRIRL
ncbi:hypothetical protein D3C71_1523680 [compost metagenome]